MRPRIPGFPRSGTTAGMIFVASAMFTSCTSSSHPSTNRSPASPGPGPALVVSPFGSCPQIALGSVDSRAKGAARRIAPLNPDGGSMCRYGSITSHGEHLVAQARLSAPTARRLAAMLDSLSVARGSVACPADDGERDVLAFAYKNQAVADVEVSLSGCSTANNGHIFLVATFGLLKTLATITGKSPGLSPQG